MCTYVQYGFIYIDIYSHMDASENKLAEVCRPQTYSLVHLYSNMTITIWKIAILNGYIVKLNGPVPDAASPMDWCTEPSAGGPLESHRRLSEKWEFQVPKNNDIPDEFKNSIQCQMKDGNVHICPQFQMPNDGYTTIQHDLSDQNHDSNTKHEDLNIPEVEHTTGSTW